MSKMRASMPATLQDIIYHQQLKINNKMAERIYSVVNTLTNEIVFSGTLRECETKIINDQSGFLELAYA